MGPSVSALPLRKQSRLIYIVGGVFAVFMLWVLVLPRDSLSLSGRPKRIDAPATKQVSGLTVTSLELSNASIIQTSRYFDNRGFFQELFNQEKYPDFSKNPMQISMSMSARGVVRGLHRSPYFKLITVMKGSIIDVLVDLDPKSPTFKQWRSVELSQDEAVQVFIPPRFGHGFIALEDDTIVCYAQGGTFAGKNEMDVSIFDSELAIDLPQLKDRSNLIMSEKDARAPTLEQALAKWQETHP